MLQGADGIIRYASPSTTRVLGYAPEELVGRQTCELMHPDDLAWSTEQFALLLQGPGTSYTGTFRYRKELNRPDRVGHSAVGEVNNTRLALSAFLESVRNGRPPVATVRHGRDAVLACLLVREAVYRKRAVTVKELPA